MTGPSHLSQQEIHNAIEQLDAIANDEYGDGTGGFAGLLRDETPTGVARAGRVVGIALKRPFADKKPIGQYTATNARYAWPWKEGTPESEADEAPGAFALLEELRRPGPWNEPSQHRPQEEDPNEPVSWDTFKGDVDTERGLFKILVLYLDDKRAGREPKELRELLDYVDAEESAGVEAKLELIMMGFDWAVLTPILALTGVSPVAVGLGLIAARYGWRKLTDPAVARMGDQWS